MSFEKFASRWFDEYAVANNKYSEQLSKKYALQSALIPFFGNVRVDQFTSHIIEKFKAHQSNRGLSAKTINNQLAILNKCLATAYEWLDLKIVPPKGKLLRCPPPTTDYLTEKECALLLATAEGVFRDMLLLSLRTGMRQGEVKGLQWSSIIWESQCLVVRHSYSDNQKSLGTPKSNRERQIPLDDEIIARLVDLKKTCGFVFLTKEGTPFTHRRVARELERICKKAGMRRITWHVLRHTFASQLAVKGVPLPVVQMLLGHSSIGTTLRYAHMAPSTLRTAINMLSPKMEASELFGQPVVNRRGRTEWNGIQQAA